MKIETWIPIYARICADIGIDPKNDFLSSARLSLILGRKSNIQKLNSFRNDVFEVFGNAPEINFQGISENSVVVVADSALPRVRSAGIDPDIIVTDLDGDPEGAIKCSEDGAVVVIHAHGDNANLIERYAGRFSENVIGSTQNYPLHNIFNFFGFTDGDRAVFLAHYLGARAIILRGFDFDRPQSMSGNLERKRLKLKWARYLITMLRDDENVRIEFR
ncbi:MAG: 6-hydroxymethylpterin diphosphokinase MptE-like protein [Thermoplasmataceae archaeon]